MKIMMILMMVVMIKTMLVTTRMVNIVGQMEELVVVGRRKRTIVTCLQALKLAGSRVVKICLKCDFWSTSTLINY